MTQKEYFLRMQSEKATLFPPKENYLMTHTANGKNIYFSQLSNNIQRRMRYENIFQAAVFLPTCTKIIQTGNQLQ